MSAMEIQGVKKNTVTSTFMVSRAAWVSICAGVFYTSLKEQKTLTLASALRIMLDKIEEREVIVDDERISDFLDHISTEKDVTITVALPADANHRLGALRARLQQLANYRITTPLAVHFAMALAPRPFW